MVRSGGEDRLLFKKVLTNVKDGIYVDEWSISSDELSVDGKWLIEKQRLKGGLSDGVDVITIDNGALSYTIIPTRGMGIWKGEYKGVYLGWKSPIENPVHPRNINLETRGGLGWLEGFNEWMVRCGLYNFGAPGTDIITDNMGRRIEIPLTLHGRIANIPAEVVRVKIKTTPTVELGVEGVVHERAMFGPNLKLTTNIKTTPESNKIKIVDVIENRRGVPDEMQILYHCNYGTPILEDGARVVAPFKIVAPRDQRAAEGIDNFNVYGPPTSGFMEQVYFCELLSNEEGYTKVALVNRDETVAAAISFSTRELPYFTIWKHTNSLEEGYVTGLEPATSFPNVKSFERTRNRVIKLEPGEAYKVELELSIHVGKEKVQEVMDEIERLRGGVEPKIFRKPIPEYSPT